jgi:hypothetical protein
MLKKIVIGFGLLVLIAVVVIYGKYFFSKAMNARAAVKNVNEQHAAAVCLVNIAYGTETAEFLV